MNQDVKKSPLKQGRPFWQREGIMSGAVDTYICLHTTNKQITTIAQSDIIYDSIIECVIVSYVTLFETQSQQ